MITRLLSIMKTDLTLQIRTNLYSIGIVAGVFVAVALAWLSTPEDLSAYVPTLMLLVVGGTTMFYVAAMILFEKEQGTLPATFVSPIRTAEYLWSKIITLTLLATVEAAVMIGGAMSIMSLRYELTLPDLPLLLVGVLLIGMLYTLVGILLVVRYDKITEFLIPMAGVAVILQLPFLYFLGWVEHPVLLLIPTSAPTVIMQGAYVSLPGWKWLYGVLFSALPLIGLTVWAHRAFTYHVRRKSG